MKTYLPLIILILMPFLKASEHTWLDTKGRSITASFIKLNQEDTQQPLSVTVDVKSQKVDIKWELLSLASQEQALKLDKELTLSKSPFIQELSKNMVKLDGKSIKSYKPEKAPNPKYIAIYYSASWCPPCKVFTPKLVEFYNKNKSDKFEIVLVSSDKEKKAMEDYIKDDKMPWLALKHSKIDSSTDTWKSFAGRSIPGMVIIDPQGNVLSHSHVDDKYLGPTKVMNDLQKLISQDS